MKYLTRNPLEEVCQDCIWWRGENSGMLGECLHDPEVILIIGRYEECVNFLVRDLIYEFD
jgi:hypothetical protein